MSDRFWTALISVLHRVRQTENAGFAINDYTICFWLERESLTEPCARTAHESSSFCSSIRRHPLVESEWVVRVFVKFEDRSLGRRDTNALFFKGRPFTVFRATPLVRSPGKFLLRTRATYTSRFRSFPAKYGVSASAKPQSRPAGNTEILLLGVKYRDSSLLTWTNN